MHGQVPVSNLAGYRSRQNAMTATKADHVIALSHYEAVPPAVQQDLIGRHKVHDED